MQLSVKLYQQQSWIVHGIADDFQLIDCWELPIALTNQDVSSQKIFKFLVTINPSEASWVSKVLFRLRYIIGRMFRFDDARSWLPIPQTGEMSIGTRLNVDQQAENHASSVTMSAHQLGQFRLVYLFEQEALIETSNRTIYALIHLGKTDQDKIWMGIYIKSRGLLSDIYMRLIRPFRHYIVYPAWLKLIQRKWEAQ
jgi:hypothetical protein